MDDEEWSPEVCFTSTQCSESVLQQLDPFNRRLDRVEVLSFPVLVPAKPSREFAAKENPREEECNHLVVTKARNVLPAIVNFLYVNRVTKMACVYIGRYDINGTPTGVPFAASRVRSEIYRLCTQEFWPPLRADAPSRSKGGNTMQALIYVKPVSATHSFLKVILQHIRSVCFDAIDERATERQRWESRRLYIRQLDNLHCHRALVSYEDFERRLRDACRYMSDHAVTHLEETTESVRSCSTPSGAHDCVFYGHHEGIEDVHLDFKSYFVGPVQELEINATNFMCGFMNAQGYGKLVIGVHELVAATASPALGTSPNPSLSSSGKRNVIIGVYMPPTHRTQLRDIITSQAQTCLPPIPPSFLLLNYLELSPPACYQNPSTGLYSILVLWERFPIKSVFDIFRAKLNFTLKLLDEMGLCLVGIDAAQNGIDADEYASTGGSVHAYAVVEIPNISSGDMAARPKPPKDWQNNIFGKLLRQNAQKTSHHYWKDTAQEPVIEHLCILEVSINRQNHTDHKYYEGTFFTGWPEVPIWDPVNTSVALQGVNYDLLHIERLGAEKNTKHWLVSARETLLSRVFIFVCGSKLFGTLCAGQQKHRGWLPLRLTCRRANECLLELLMLPFCFSGRQKGIEPSLCQHGTVKTDRSVIRQIQVRARQWMGPLLPLPLVWWYESLGDIVCPYPYVFAPPTSPNPSRGATKTKKNCPLSLLLFQMSEHGALVPSVVLDHRDMCVKMLILGHHLESGGKLLPIYGVRHTVSSTHSGVQFECLSTYCTPESTPVARFTSASEAFANHSTPQHEYVPLMWTFPKFAQWLIAVGAENDMKVNVIQGRRFFVTAEGKTFLDVKWNRLPSKVHMVPLSPHSRDPHGE